ncbi:MAG TPA: 3'-5' exonuclease [Longimicrobium sp.]|jgi:DNA polymerase-3 subunit epsilon|uniref:3'-5' exonuclease n=1 Tax=Longimicrobium sp. TaxID=2029185 RepID=UPI002EDA8905
MPDTVLRDAALERIADALDTTTAFRVARRFEPRGRYAEPDGKPTYRALFVDVETTGLDTERDHIIQLALLPFEYAPSTGRIYAVGEPIVQMEDPGRAIPPEITMLTGISDADVAGRWIDEQAVDSLAAAARLVVAHNAAFDRPLLERRLPLFREMPWACSRVEVPWAEHGIAAAKLEFVLFKHCRAFFEGHRADQDCHAALHALATPFRSGELPFALLLKASRRRTVRVWALDAPYEARLALKSRGYRWSPGEGGRPKAWYVDRRDEEVEGETEWLSEAVYLRRRDAPWRLHAFGAVDRYSVRV